MATKFDPSIPDENRGPAMFITVTVLTVAIVLTTTLRVITKLVKRLEFGWDDYMILLGTALNLVGNIFEYLAIASGFGRHTQYLKPTQQLAVDKWLQLCIILPFFAVWSVKLSICFFLLNIIRDTKHRIFRWCIYGLIVVTTISTFVGCLLWGLQASPIEKLWNPNIPGIRKSPESFAISAFVELSLACFTDILYALSPIYFLWNVQMSKRRKLPILALTGCGVLVTVVGILDIVYAQSLYGETDLTFTLVNLFICDLIEQGGRTTKTTFKANQLDSIDGMNRDAAWAETMGSSTDIETKSKGSGEPGPVGMTDYNDSLSLRGMPQYTGQAISSRPSEIHVVTDIKVKRSPPYDSKYSQ